MQAGRSETKRTRFEFLVWLDGSLTAAAQQPHGANRRYRFQFIHKVFGLRESPVGGGSCGALGGLTAFGLLTRKNEKYELNPNRNETSSGQRQRRSR